ncbi:MAG: ABC transporter substrate-binding protein [Armatimonadetes bacterium]|nr:ABC transporter substrate-binding protein [Armatimonadota bacterium]MDW8121611.1 ABC transporter substrate-binding protein [Armatimonadota bacterium]
MVPILKKRIFCWAILTLLLFVSVNQQAGSLQVGAGKKPYTIAVVPKSVAFDFWQAVKAGAEKAAKEEGARIIWRGPSDETDIAGQQQILENLITQRVDALVFAACDARAMVPVAQKALKAGIKVITIDSGLDPDVSLCFVATDNIKGARIAAETLARLIGYEGKVGLIPFVPGAATSIEREKGFKEGLKKYPKVRLVRTLYSQSDVQKAMQVTENMLTAFPDLEGIFAANEPGAVGAARVLKARNLAGKVKLVAFDAAPTEIKALEEGVIQALIVQNPFKMGEEGVKMAIKALRGEKIPRRIDTGVTVVTKSNMHQPQIHRLLYPLEVTGR